MAYSRCAVADKGDNQVEAAALPSELEVIGRIYDAALNPRLWPEVVREIGELQGASKSLLLTSMHSPAQGGLVFPVGIPESAMQLWAERYIQHDLWSQSIAAKGLYEDEFASGGAAPRAIVFVTDPEGARLPEARLLLDLYGLTPAEARLARELATGESLGTVAARLGVSENTVKSQLRAVYDKTRTGRQAELVKLLLSLGATDAR